MTLTTPSKTKKSAKLADFFVKSNRLTIAELISCIFENERLTIVKKKHTESVLFYFLIAGILILRENVKIFA